jgi:hypothetical protein
VVWSLEPSRLLMMLWRRLLYPRRFIADVGRQIVESVRIHGFASLDPVMSDLFSAELENAVCRLMEMVSEQLDVVLQTREKLSDEGKADIRV